jgi:hypothetical protein
MPDQTIKCKDCGVEFVFTEGEQRFFANKVDKVTGRPWDPPKRCKPCRMARKQVRTDQNAHGYNRNAPHMGRFGGHRGGFNREKAPDRRFDEYEW